MSIAIALLGGLALFLYGMQMMSNGLEAAAGNRMKKILERLTANRVLGVLVGAGITAVIQSSSATTVMAVGFVNSGLMTIKQAVWIIMGANIGTTITGQLIALDIGEIAPLFAFLGVAMVVFFKRDSFNHYGNIIAGLGVLFIGMDMMSAAMMPLRESPVFTGLMTQFESPVVGILVGMIFTAIIQSSSASVGILQALAVSGLIGFDSAVYVLFGQNIGTCITAVLASIGTSRVAKRTMIIHLLFNVIGTTIFAVFCALTPLASFVGEWTPNNPSAQIANMHTLFNVTTTLLLIPFGGYLAKLSSIILPDKASEKAEGMHLEYIQMESMAGESKIGGSAIALSNIGKELARMTQMTKENIDYSFSAALKGTARHIGDAEKTEEYVDFLNKEISKYISGIMAHENNTSDSIILSSFFKISGNLERISDHAVNICEYAKTMEKRNAKFSENAQSEIEQMRKISLEAIELVSNKDEMNEIELERISEIEQKIDDMTDAFRQNQLKRMHDGCCSDEACILYSEMLTDFERIGDHVLNIAEELEKIGKAK